MTDRYGPQTAQIEALLQRIRNLTEKEAEALAAAPRAAGRATARDAVRYAAWFAGRSAARYAARDAARYDVWPARGDAVQALCVRDLIGQHGFTQEHYDTLVAPWEAVMDTEWTREEA